MLKNKKVLIIVSALCLVFIIFNIFFVCKIKFLRSIVPCKVEPKSKYGGTLVYGRGNDAISLDPADIAEGEAIKISMMINEGLVRIIPGTTEVEPCLATDWKISDDGLTWTFNLRRGVNFHDGTTFNSDAVLFTFNRQHDKNHPYHIGKFIYWDYMFKNIKEVKKLDDYTVQILIDEAHAPFLANLAIWTAAIVSPTAMQEKGAIGFSMSPVGTGPFKFVEWVPDDKIELVANDDYWDGRPYLDKVIYKVIKDNSMRLIALDKGDIDLMDGVTPVDIHKIVRNHDLNIISRPGLNVGFMAMNCQKKPFSDKRVRQAINYAINKKPIVKLIYQGVAIAAVNPLPPSMWGHNDDIKPYDYDIEKAHKLLTEAGYPNGFKVELDVMENTRTYMPQPTMVAEAIKENLSVVGIDVEYVVRPWKEHLERGYVGAHQMYLLGWMGDNGDPDNFLYLLLDKDNAVMGSSSNVAFYENDELHDILIKARQSSRFDDRVALYRRAQEIIHEDAPWVPLAHVSDLVAVNKKVKNIVVQPLFPHAHIKDVWLEE